MNTQLLSSLTLVCCSLITALPAQEVANGHRKPSDQEISDCVEDELQTDLAVPASKIDVSVLRGVVTLQGTIDNLLARERAVRVAETVRGVRSVVDRLDVAPPRRRSDDDIRSDVAAALLADPATDSYEVVVEVKNGVVTLKGSVDSTAEKRLCGTVAKGVRGVLGLNNRVDVAFTTDRPDSEIAADVKKTLQWNQLVDDDLVDVEVDDGVVKLSGTVGSASEKRLASELAWLAGAKSVDVAGLAVARWARDDDLRAHKYADRDDSAVEKAVEDAMVDDPRVASFQVDTGVKNGVVTLRGVVDNLQAKRAAARDARDTVGAWHVINRLKVRPTGVAGDEATAKRLRAALRRDPYVDRYEIAVSVRNGTAYLYGDVDSQLERREADDLAARTGGVVEVRNHLRVSGFPTWSYDRYVDRWWPHGYDFHSYGRVPVTTLSDREIRSRICDQLWWSPFVDLDDVRVTVKDGVATLRGRVDSRSECAAATENAYEGGAVAVRNDLQIGPSGDGS